MRDVNWTGNTAVGDSVSSFTRLEPGGYVVKVVGATDYEDRQYFELVYDIAEGPRTGYYSDAWGVEHKNAHRVVMSYKPQAVGMMEARLNAINASNPGFDGVAACKANRFDFFIGRVFGVNLREAEFMRDDGSIGTRIELGQVVTAQAVRDGLVKPMRTKKLSGTAPTPAPASSPTGFDPSTAMNIEIPFA